jgi:MFS family permease
MDRNLRLYPVYQGLWNLLFWTPIFFLYFSSILPLAQVLQLEAIYYAAVVLLELPSGYLSDRAGRRATLLVATLSWTAAGILFAVGSNFPVFVVAQILLASGMAFNSGTDSSLLYESLDALGRREEIAEHEARAQAAGFGAAAVAAVVGGAAAGLDFRLAYVLSSIAAFGAFLTASRFREPPVDGTLALPPLGQFAACGRALGRPTMLWVFSFAVAMTVFNHIPYEFFQPWLDLLLAQGDGRYDPTPAVAGVFVAAISLAAAWAGPRAPAARARFGTPATLLILMGLQGAVMLGMAFFLHPVLLLLILARSVPRAMAEPVIRAEVHPRLRKGIRATFLSMQSLAGRLAFSLSIGATSLAMGQNESLTFPVMSRLLEAFALILGVVLLVLWVQSRRVSWASEEVVPTSEQGAVGDRPRANNSR